MEMQLEGLEESIDMSAVVFVIFSPIKDMSCQAIDDLDSFLSFRFVYHGEDRIFFEALAEQRRIPFQQTQ